MQKRSRLSQETYFTLAGVALHSLAVFDAGDAKTQIVDAT
jgi:hypothetical protein